MKQGITSLIFLFVLYPHKFLQAQVNLVLNPSFENVIGCPEGQGFTIVVSAEHWYNPTSTTPDLFLSCVSSTAFNHVPDNAWGTQNPKSGQNYAGISAEYKYLNSPLREYVGGTLAETLEQGRKYAVSINVNSSSRYSSRFKSIGIYFSDTLPIKKYDPFPSLYYFVLPAIPQVTFDTIVSDTINWVELTDTLLAQGGELYFAIGLFTDNLSSTFDTVYYDTTNQFTVAYYFIDDVSVTLIEDSISPPPPRPPAFQLFPNPNDGVFSISGPFVVDDRIVVYDAVGRLIFSYHVTAENNLLQLFPQLATGVYVCRVERKDEVVFKRRVVVAK
jgi:Secretion system C-terminal sorting domain